MRRPTSKKSFAEMVASGELCNKCFQAYRWLKLAGPVTACELQEYIDTNKTNKTAPAAIVEAWKVMSILERMKMVASTHSRDCGVTGKTAIVWRAEAMSVEDICDALRNPKKPRLPYDKLLEAYEELKKKYDVLVKPMPVYPTPKANPKQLSLL